MDLDLVSRRYEEVLGSVPAGVCLLAVSKKQPYAKVERLLDLGHRCFGENYLQEAEMRWGCLSDPENSSGKGFLGRYSDVRLHFIGRVQRNKIRKILSLFHVIEGVGSEEVLASVCSEISKLSSRVKVFVQINIGREESRGGLFPERAMRIVPDYCDYVDGIMCVHPASGDPVGYFADMKELAESLGVGEISMGMSRDFMRAIECGATEVRVGSLIFGARM